MSTSVSCTAPRSAVQMAGHPPGRTGAGMNVVQKDTTTAIQPDVWVIGTTGTVKDRLASFVSPGRRSHRHSHSRPFNPREDQGPGCPNADGYHEISSSAALLAQRIGALLPPRNPHEPRFSRLTHPTRRGGGRAMASHFNAAGAGILTGRTARFFDTLSTLGAGAARLIRGASRTGPRPTSLRRLGTQQQGSRSPSRTPRAGLLDSGRSPHATARSPVPHRRPIPWPKTPDPQ